jgi:hypothetical protein
VNKNYTGVKYDDDGDGTQNSINTRDKNWIMNGPFHIHSYFHSENDGCWDANVCKASCSTFRIMNVSSTMVGNLAD